MMFVWKILNAEKAKKLLRRHIINDEQKYIMERIKFACKKGDDIILLHNFYCSSAMDKKSYAYLQTFEGKNWIESLGYKIKEIMEDELIIKWEI